MSALLGIQVVPERNQNLTFSATLHLVYKSDIWDYSDVVPAFGPY